MARRSPWMNQDLDDFRDLARTFCEKEIKPNVETYIANKQVDRDLWNKAGEVGLLCLSIPEEYGGGGGTFAHEAILIEEQARVGDSSWGVSLHNGIVAHYILKYGTEAQKHEWLPKMASGEAVAAIAMTEPGTGSDLQNVRTKAIREGDEYVINGAKTFITNGAQADVVVVVVKTNPEEAAAGISLVIVPTDTPGFSRGRVLDKIGMKGQDTSELNFSDVRVPVANLLGTEEGQGFIQLMEQLPQERLIVALSNVAAMELCFEETLRYDNSTQMLMRTTLEDVTVRGVRIPAGESVLLLVGSANRDPAAFPDPDVYDIGRDTSAMLSFGRGTHFCMGASLARLEARVAFEEWWKRFPRYEVVPEGIRRVHSVNVRGFAALPVKV